MDYGEINWAAIAIATILNLVLGYLFFESSWTTKWRSKFETEGWRERGRFWLFIGIGLYSGLLAWIISVFTVMSIPHEYVIISLVLFAFGIFYPADRKQNASSLSWFQVVVLGSNYLVSLITIVSLQ